MSAEKGGGVAAKVGGWIGILGTLVTAGLTVLNASWSREISVIETNLKEREAELKAREVELEGERDRLARYEFVHKLFAGVLDQNASQKTLTVNLISLALGENDAKLLFAGLQASDDPSTRNVGTLGREVVDLSNLVLQMDSAVRENRIGAVDQLIERYGDNPVAVDQALRLLEGPNRDTLSASGRINALVFLQNAEQPAWNEQTLNRAEAAIGEIKTRSDQGIAAVGPQTQEQIDKLSGQLQRVRAAQPNR